MLNANSALARINRAISRTDTLPLKKFIKAVDTDRLEHGLAILEVLLAIRFLFDLFNASTLNLLAKLVYAVTFPFTAPFLGLFGKSPSYALSNGELETLAAMLVYPLVVWAAIAIMKTNRKKTAQRTDTETLGALTPQQQI